MVKKILNRIKFFWRGPFSVEGGERETRVFFFFGLIYDREGGPEFFGSLREKNFGAHSHHLKLFSGPTCACQKKIWCPL